MCVFPSAVSRYGIGSSGMIYEHVPRHLSLKIAACDDFQIA